MSKSVSQNQNGEPIQDSLLQVDSVNVTYTQGGKNIRAVRDVSLHLEKGETVGLVGESGSGKSTLAKAIVRYLDENGSVTKGDIYFKGESLLAKTKDELKVIRGGEIAHVAQSPSKALNPSIQIGDQIKEVIKIHRNPTDDDEAMEQVYDVLSEVNIPDPEQTATQYPHELSGGMLQRALIALSLSCDPDLLILDEPTTGLDVTTQSKLLDLIEELKTGTEMGILIISHNLGVISDIADRVNILYAGEMMEKGAVKDVFSRPANPYTQGLLASIPRLDEDIEYRPIPGKIPEVSDVPEGCIFANRCDFASEECETGDIPMETVQSDPIHESRCIHVERVLQNPVLPDERVRSKETGGDPILEAVGVKKHFGETSLLDKIFGGKPTVKAVDGVDFEIRESETVGLVGESGCGKSTLGRILINLLNPTEGTIKYRGKPLEELSGGELAEYRAETQIVFQDPDSSLNPRKKVKEIVGRPLKLSTNLARKERQERVSELLEQVNLSADMARKYPYELSGGEKQRIAIARAFAAQPSLIILDEPVSSLDVSEQANILNLLDDLREEYGTSYLFISHDLSLVNAVSDRMGVMYLGKIIEVGTREEIFNPPHHPYTRALVSSAPDIDPETEKAEIHLKGDVPSARTPPDGCNFQTRCPQKIGDVCENEEPDLEAIDQHSHRVSCHLDNAEMDIPTENVVNSSE